MNGPGRPGPARSVACGLAMPPGARHRGVVRRRSGSGARVEPRGAALCNGSSRAAVLDLDAVVAGSRHDRRHWPIG